MFNQDTCSQVRSAHPFLWYVYSIHMHKSQHSELSSDAKFAQQQPAQHSDIFHQNVQHISKGNQSHSDPPYHPHLKPALKLPLCNAIDDWANADHYIRVHVVPLVVATNDLSQKAILLVEKTYDYFAQRFGTINRSQHRSRRRLGRFTRAMTRVRDQKNEVRKKYRAALRSNQPKETIVQLASSYHRLVREHNRIRRQKELLDMQSRMQKDRNRCAANMWKFAGELLDDDTHTGTPPFFSEAEATSFFRDTYCSQCQQSFQTPSWMVPRELPINPFDTGNISISEITSQLKRSRNGSAPCP